MNSPGRSSSNQINLETSKDPLLDFYRLATKTHNLSNLDDTQRKLFFYLLWRDAYEAKEDPTVDYSEASPNTFNLYLYVDWLLAGGRCNYLFKEECPFMIKLVERLFEGKGLMSRAILLNNCWGEGLLAALENAKSKYHWSDMTFDQWKTGHVNYFQRAVESPDIDAGVPLSSLLDHVKPLGTLGEIGKHMNPATKSRFDSVLVPQIDFTEEDLAKDSNKAQQVFEIFATPPNRDLFKANLITRGKCRHILKDYFLAIQRNGNDDQALIRTLKTSDLFWTTSINYCDLDCLPTGYLSSSRYGNNFEGVYFARIASYFAFLPLTQNKFEEIGFHPLANKSEDQIQALIDAFLADSYNKTATTNLQQNAALYSTLFFKAIIHPAFQDLWHRQKSKFSFRVEGHKDVTYICSLMENLAVELLDQVERKFLPLKCAHESFKDLMPKAGSIHYDQFLPSSSKSITKEDIEFALLMLGDPLAYPKTQIDTPSSNKPSRTSKPSTTTPPSSSSLVIGIVIALIVIVAIVVFMVVRRRKATGNQS